MVYTPNTFTTSTLCFLIQFKVKEQQQRIYFRKFCKEKCWQNIKSKELADKYLQKKNVQNRKNLRKFLPCKYDVINKYHILDFFDFFRYVSTINSLF